MENAGLPARAGHSVTRLPSGNLLVFGGLDNQQNYHNDLWEIDLNKLHWFSLAGSTKGAPPKPRAYHSYGPLTCLCHTLIHSMFLSLDDPRLHESWAVLP